MGLSSPGGRSHSLSACGPQCIRLSSRPTSHKKPLSQPEIRLQSLFSQICNANSLATLRQIRVRQKKAMGFKHTDRQTDRQTNNKEAISRPTTQKNINVVVTLGPTLQKGPAWPQNTRIIFFLASSVQHIHYWNLGLKGTHI